MRPIISLLYISLLINSLALVSNVNAQELNSLSDSFDKVQSIADSVGVNTNDTPEGLIATVIRRFLVIVGTVALALVVWGGFVYLTSAGNENRAALGKRIVLGAIIGLIIIGLSAVIVNFTISLFGSEAGS